MMRQKMDKRDREREIGAGREENVIRGTTTADGNT